MRTLEELVNLVNQWAEEKGIHEKGNMLTQFLKTYEEIGESIEAICNNNTEELSDAIGDITVTLINACWFLDKDAIKTLLEKKQLTVNYIVENKGEQSLVEEPKFIFTDMVLCLCRIISEVGLSKYPKEELIKNNVLKILVNLEVLCYNYNLDFTTCLNGAYEIISKRSGKVVNGQFIKDK